MTLKWRNFSIDIPSFLAWIETNLSTPVIANAQPWGFQLIRKHADGRISFNESEQEQIQDAFDALTEGAEAAKRALPSRKHGPARLAFVSQVKAFIATKDWAAMSVAERKIAMGTEPTMAEFDTLTIE